MFKNLRHYGIYKPNILTISVLVAIVMFALHNFLSIVVGVLAVIVFIMTIVRNIYRYHLINALIKDQKISSDMHALDLATKRGYGLVELTNQAKSAFVDGFEEDFDDYTKEAKVNAKRDSDISRIKLNHGDVRYLPYPTDYFNVISIMPTATSRFASSRESNYQDGFQEAIRVLAPKGTALIVMPKKKAMQIAQYLFSQDKMVEVYLARPEYQLLMGYQPIVVKKKARTETKKDSQKK